MPTGMQVVRVFFSFSFFPPNFNVTQISVYLLKSVSVCIKLLYI